MNRGMNTVFMACLIGGWRFCVLTRNVRNIWNISNLEKEIQQIQGVESEKLFQSNRNTVEQTGTNLFRHVPAISLKPEHFKKGCSLSATGLIAILPEQMFRHVPVWWNIDQSSVSPERRGLQHCASRNVPDVPDAQRAYAFPSLPPLPSSSPRCPPWPN